MDIIKNPISKKIWKDRYCKNNETIEDNLRRVAKFVAFNEQEENDFYNLMKDKLFFVGGRTMSNAGIGSSLTLNNCFTLNSVPDSINGIFDTVRIGALTQKAGGGTGYDFSLIRPSNTPTKNDAVASGVVSFMQVFNTQTETILQGNRRGANMGILNIYHPDIFDFLNSKSFDEGKLERFNLSIMIDDDFMKAVEENKDIDLHYPVYDDKWHIIKDETKWTHSIKQNAKELYELIIRKAYDTGEYGVLFYDNMNKDNNTWYCETIICTNPCSEYISGTLFNMDKPEDYKGACNLGSIFLHNFIEEPFTDNSYINFIKLEKAVRLAVRMLDNIIDKNNFPHQSFENYQKKMRTIGLGITGLANTLAMLGIKFGSDKAIEKTDNIMNIITICAYKESIELAKEKGSFELLDKDKFIQSNFIQKHLIDEKIARNNYINDWENIVEDIKKYGIRNARLLSIAPVGTLSLTFGENCSSGLEPTFMFSQKRKVKIGGQSEDDINIVEFNDYAYDLWLNTIKKDDEKLPDYFVSALDLSVAEHLKMLKAVTYHIDMSCSKTINIPEDYSFEDTKDVYKWCHQNGIKGCTIFRPNSLRQGIFITEDTKTPPQDIQIENIKLDSIQPISRGEMGKTHGTTDKYNTACGSFYLTINRDKYGNIVETFVNTSKNGTCKSNIDGLNRMMSLALRSGTKVEEIIDQLKGISCSACSRVKNKGEKQIDGLSCPDILSQALSNEYYNIDDKLQSDKIKPVKTTSDVKFKNICPDCKEELVFEGGCNSCKACGYSKCE